ncbi:NUDIX domain-containing protein [Streptomyces sp. UNOB3_S3]|uniref:NUDIX domain-containing protein n=1 Tax=Streptomyces sp. UNOB3_S3 TaxID=2871682 RepID=UPI0035B16958
MRGDWPRPGTWWLPGGGQQAGETLAACAEREVFEETGVRVKAEGLVVVREYIQGNHPEGHRMLSGAGHRVDAMFRCRILQEPQARRARPGLRTARHRVGRAGQDRRAAHAASVSADRHHGRLRRRPRPGHGLPGRRLCMNHHHSPAVGLCGSRWTSAPTPSAPARSRASSAHSSPGTRATSTT